MTAKEWLDKHNIDLSKIHGNIGDYDGNIFIKTKDGWIFWNAQGIMEKLPNAAGQTVTSSDSPKV